MRGHETLTAFSLDWYKSSEIGIICGENRPKQAETTAQNNNDKNKYTNIYKDNCIT